MTKRYGAQDALKRPQPDTEDGLALLYVPSTTDWRMTMRMTRFQILSGRRGWAILLASVLFLLSSSAKFSYAGDKGDKGKGDKSVRKTGNLYRNKNIQWVRRYTGADGKQKTIHLYDHYNLVPFGRVGGNKAVVIQKDEIEYLGEGKVKVHARSVLIPGKLADKDQNDVKDVKHGPNQITVMNKAQETKLLKKLNIRTKGPEVRDLNKENLAKQLEGPVNSWTGLP